MTTTVIRTLAIREDAARRPPRGSSWRPTWPTTWCAAVSPFRVAHEITGRIVRDLYATGRDFSSLSAADWRRYSDQFGDDVVAAITPEAAVAAKRTPQSTNPAAVAAALARDATVRLASQDRSS